MSENKNAKTPADGGAGCIDGVWYGTAPTANRAITLKEMQQWIATTWKRCQDEAWRQRVDLTYHGDGNVGIGTPPDAYAQPVIGEPVERIRFIMSNQEPEAHVFAHSTTEWARVDKDLNVTHLDMELCAKGPKNVYTALAMAIWNKAVQEEREAIAKSLDKQADLACDEIDRKWAQEMAAAVRARGNT